MAASKTAHADVNICGVNTQVLLWTSARVLLSVWVGLIVPYHICGSQPKQLEVMKSCRIRVAAKCHAFYLCVTKHGSNQVVWAVIPVMFKPEPEQVMMVKVATNQSVRQAAASLTAWKRERWNHRTFIGWSWVSWSRWWKEHPHLLKHLLKHPSGTKPVEASQTNMRIQRLAIALLLAERHDCTPV